MARVNNDKAIECIRAREPFDNNSNTLGGRRSFAGWGDLPEEYRLASPEAPGYYFVYSYETPIAWVYPDGSIYMPPVRYSLTTTKHQELVARALGFPFAVRESLMKKGGNYGPREGGSW